MLEAALTPVAPFRLAASIGPPDPARRWRDGVLELAYPTSAGPAHARVWQTGDGTVHTRIDAPDAAEAHDRLRTMLTIELDTRPFLRMAERDRLLGPLAPRLRGTRPMLTATPAQALLRAVCGQLVRTSDALLFERRLVAALGSRVGDLRLPPTAGALAATLPAVFERAGLSPRRAVVLARAARRLDLAALEHDPADRAVARIRREPGLGPWSAGVLLVYGYGRQEQGLVGDLSLVRLAAALGLESDAPLVEGYGAWQGLASIWLMHHPAAGRHAARAAAARSAAGVAAGRRTARR